MMTKGQMLSVNMLLLLRHNEIKKERKKEIDAESKLI